jgi:hypothetical protein
MGETTGTAMVLELQVTQLQPIEPDFPEPVSYESMADELQARTRSVPEGTFADDGSGPPE